MNKIITRRNALKLATVKTVVVSVGCNEMTLAKSELSQVSPKIISREGTWGNAYDRVWLGGEYWANPMEDWCVKAGGAECLSSGGNRSVHALTQQITNPEKCFALSVRLHPVVSTNQNKQTPVAKPSSAGFRIGIQSDVDDYRSACFIQKGVDAGILDNTIILADQKTPLTQCDASCDALTLVLTGRLEHPQEDRVTQLVEEADNQHAVNKPNGMRIRLRLAVYTVDNKRLVAQLETVKDAVVLKGNIALVSNFHMSATDQTVAHDASRMRYRFYDWQRSGDALTTYPERHFGPILWSMYSLSDTRSADGFVMKMSAFTGPVGREGSHKILLQTQSKKGWQTQGVATLDTDAWVATFRIPQWNAKRRVEYRLVYSEKQHNGVAAPYYYGGFIQANPTQSKLKMAALTCQNDYAFPYAPVAINVKKLKPDVVFFSGDQIYESHGGYGVIREPSERALLNYLRKFYQFGWAFRDVMRNQPTLCLPDDHDVLQGNLWGESGLAMKDPSRDPGASTLSGYVEPVRVINAVHRTTLAHHPDAYDPTPMARGISVYFGEMVYGNVSFAILADRQWKSGPERLDIRVGHTGKDEAPTLINPVFNPPGLQLLGQKQESFLKKWSQDWRGHTLKAVLSQTVFAGVSTHQPTPSQYLKYDFDSGGWPASARDRAIDAMRESKALHICGDTHLGSLTQYGVRKQRDANWAYCTPAIAAGWPRWWTPDKVPLPHTNRPKHHLPNTGEYLDAFGNKIFVYAVANPIEATEENRYQRAHQKGSGFGVVTFDTNKLTYTLEAYRFLIDITDGDPKNQFSGWPVTIHQEENKGENRLA